MSIIVLILLLFLCLAISVNDFLFYRIENEYVISLCAIYPILCITGICGDHILFAIISAVCAFLIFFAFNQLNLIGGGDVKLVFPVMLLVEANLYDFFVVLSICSLFIAIIYILLRKKIYYARKRIINYLNKKHFNEIVLKIALLSLSKIDVDRIASGNVNKGVMQQELPYGIVLSIATFYLIFNKFLMVVS